MPEATPSRPGLPAILLRQLLGILSLVLGLALLGECAAHTVRGLLAQGPGMRHDIAFRLLKAAFFQPGAHGLPYQILLGTGFLLTLLGIALNRAWAVPLFLVGAFCFATVGGMAVERVVLKRGAEAAVFQDGVSGIWRVFAEAQATGRLADPLMILWVGVAAWVAGLFVTQGLAPKPAPAPRRMMSARGPSAPASAAGMEALSESKADTSVDLDLSPDLETAEVPAPLDEGGLPQEPSPEPDVPLDDLAADAPTPSAEDGADPVSEPSPESGSDPAPLPESGPSAGPDPEIPSEPSPSSDEPMQEEAVPPEPVAVGRPALGWGGLVLGLAATTAATGLWAAPRMIPEGALLQVWGGGVAAALAALGLVILSRPLSLPGKIAAGTAVLGLAGCAARLGMGS